LGSKRSGPRYLRFGPVDVEALRIGDALGFQLAKELLHLGRDDHRFSRPQRRPVIQCRRQRGPYGAFVPRDDRTARGTGVWQRYLDI
jgi:hypothetical protein